MMSELSRGERLFSLKCERMICMFKIEWTALGSSVLTVAFLEVEVCAVLDSCRSLHDMRMEM